MAWIESHQELRHHPKLSAVCRILSAERPHVAGHLHFLWWWCMDYALDGDLSKYSEQQIADASEWRGEAKQYVDALVTAGFIDRIEHSVKIHDWLEFCGELVLKRLDRRQNKSDKISRIERRTADNVRRKLPNSSERPPTVPYRTVPKEKTLVQQAEANASVERFEAFYKEYPRHQGRGAALKAWLKLSPSQELFERMTRAVRDQKDTVWNGTALEYIPLPATWLNGKRWEDELGASKPKGVIL